MAVVEKQIQSVELSFEGLLKLLGGSSEQRQRFFEIFKKITTPAEHQIVESSLVAIGEQVHTMTKSLQALHNAAREIGPG